MGGLEHSRNNQVSELTTRLAPQITEDLTSFAESLKKRDLKTARAWLENKRQTLQTPNDFEKGFLLALNGMIASLESNQSFSLMKKILDGTPQEEVQQIYKDFKKRAEQRFRPALERGFDTAWAMILQHFLQAE